VPFPFLSRLFRRKLRPDPRTVERFIESSRDVLCHMGPDNRIRFVSPAAVEVFGRPPEALIGVGPEAVVHPDDLKLITADIVRRAAGDQDGATMVRIVRPDGSFRWVEITGRSRFDLVTGELLESLLVMRDVTERKALEDRLSREALTDGLTGLANRRAFDETLQREWKRSVREQTPLSLILIDLDRFKSFNDDHGHPAGDACLRATAGAVARAIHRPGDQAARYGGEELAVILPGADAGGAAQIAEAIRAGIEGLGVLHPSSPHGVVTASVGVATAGPSSQHIIHSPEALIEMADTALYRAKAGGRNRVETARVLAAVRNSRAA
jgi:diguanylate cyclase (GGDEF)-like protein/PAS domain S-box-containing protein